MILKVGFTDVDNLTSDSIIIMINKHQSSSILITTALIAATVLSLSVIVHALLDDAEARLSVTKSQTKINGCSDSVKCSTLPVQ
jgi:hypothetical protein